jgi:hypothetical protein
VTGPRERLGLVQETQDLQRAASPGRR